MADLEALSAPNRSIWQPISYMNPIDTYVGNKGKLAALKATDLEFQKADNQLAIDDALQNSAKSLEHDNPAMREYLAQHKSKIDNIYQNTKDPYELNRQIKKTSTEFANELADPNSFLGSAGIGLKNYYENLKEAKTPDEKLLIEDNKANYQGVKLDPSTKSYQESILKKREFAPNIDPLDEQNKGVQLYKEDAYKNGSTTFSPDKSFLVHTEKGNRYISKPEALDYFQKTLNTNSDLQLKLKQQAEINTIKELGLGARTKNPDEFKQVYDNNRNKLYSDWINSSIDKLAHDDKSSNETLQANPYEMLKFKQKSIQDILAKPVEKPNIGGGVYKNNNIQYSKDNNFEYEKFIKNNKGFVDNNGKIYSPEEITKLAKENNIPQGVVERYMSDRYYSGYDEKSKPKMEDDKISEQFLEKIGIKLKPISEEDKVKFDNNTKIFNYGALEQLYPVEVERVKSYPINLQNEAMNKLIFTHKNQLDNFRKEYIEGIEQKSTRVSEASPSAKSKYSYPKNTPPDELTSSIAYSSASGNNAVNKNKTVPEFLEESGIDTKKGDSYKFDLIGTNLTHGNLSGGKEYKVTVDKKDGTQKIFTVLTEPSGQQKKNLQPVRLLNETFSTAYPSKSYFILNNGQLEKLDSDIKIQKAESDGKLITLNPVFSKNNNETNVNAFVQFQGDSPIPLEYFNKEYEKIVAPESEKSLEYNVNSDDVKKYQLLMNMDDNMDDNTNDN